MKNIKVNITRLQIKLLHLVFWAMLILPPFLFRYNGPNYNFSEYFLYRLLINNGILAILFYLNAYYFFPIIFKKKGVIIYLISLIFCIVLAFFLAKYVDQDLFPVKRKWNRSPISNILSYIFILVVSTSYRIIIDYIKDQKLLKEKETENLKTELSFLKSQVSPHFMFNVLNNLVSLARKKSDKMEPALIQLSNLLRYMLYEGNQGKINLLQELKYLNGYIDLQKLRFGDDAEIIFDYQGDLNEFELEPMLLIPFVENAFKHGMGSQNKPIIKITMGVENKTLTFVVENEIIQTGESKDNSSGIGLANVKRRLELLYKQNYSLNISEANNFFRVQLKIKMND
jgi:two-component system LytT family sensor kinase